MTVLDELITRVSAMTDAQRNQLAESALQATKHMAWIPSPGPQTQAYFCKADMLLYGGEPGGGKSSLLLGLALTAHQRSLILRRQYTDLGHLIEELLKFNDGREGFNGSPPPKLRRSDGRVIDLGAAARVGDEQHWQGNPHDFIGVDEATQFSEIQIRFLMGWLRNADNPNQRKRVVLATNPPLTADGLWIVEMFAPWLDDKFHNPAKPGELRYVISDEDGKDKWVDGPEPVMVNGKLVTPMSRTYIPASVNDNPYLVGSGYDKQLDAMPEPFRSILMGGFKTSFRDSPNQAIPTDWIRQANKRWAPTPPKGVPMCTVGVDASGGGVDPMIMSARYDGWYAPIIEIPGKELPMESLGRTAAGHIISMRRDKALIIIDLGGGYGGSAYEVLKENDVEVNGYKGAEASARRSRDGRYRFTNKRSAAYWLFREALDPGQPGGSPIALPEDPKLMADLASPTFEVTPNGIKIEPKEKVVERLGRSTDRGDAVVMAWFEGAKEITHALEWADQKQSMRGQRPHVVMGRR